MSNSTGAEAEQGQVNNNAPTTRAGPNRLELLAIEYPVARDAQSIQIKLHLHRDSLHVARRATVRSPDYRRLTSLFEVEAMPQLS